MRASSLGLSAHNNRSIAPSRARPGAHGADLSGPPSAAINPLRPAILGAVDGTITSFVVVASGFAGSVTRGVVLIIGFASLLADAVSMASGEFLSVRVQGLGWLDALRHGLVCGVSFVVVGSAPLVAFAAAADAVIGSILSSAAFFGCLVSIGIVRARLSGDEQTARSVLEVCLVGGGAGAVAVAAGWVGARIRGM